MNEADTRAEKIEPKLRSSGWTTGGDIKVNREVIAPGTILANGDRDEEKTLKPDFVLSYKNRKVATIEAKSDEEYVGKGVAQAIKYAKRLDLRFTYSTNGDEIYEIDMKTGYQGLVKKFPSPEEIWNKTYSNLNDWAKKFDEIPFNDFDGIQIPRYYQEAAANNALEAISKDQKRILLNLATGTGKTFIAFQIAWKLFNSKWNKDKDGRYPKILFLADRNTLADQALGDFRGFKDDSIERITPEQVKRDGKVQRNRSLFFTIFQTFMSGEDHIFGQYEKDFFDLIIIDECHRGGANDESSWRGILEYFSPATQIGLTATPKRDVNVDTYSYFGEPVYSYKLKDGIEDGFLTPFRVKKIESTLDTYTYSKSDNVTVLKGMPEEGRTYQEHEFNKIIYIEEREKYRVIEMLKLINQDDKTIVFCANQKHAANIRDLINQNSKVSDPEYCVRVGAEDGDIGDSYLKKFRNNERVIPTILTSSLKLTTGVDAKNIRNIVLMRPVTNMVEFKQIVGRGTRTFIDKNYFTIIDFVKAYEHFHDPAWDGEEQVPTNPKNPTTPDIKDPEDETDTLTNKEKIEIKLSDGKIRNIQSMTSTSFFIDNKPVDVRKFIEHLFNTLKLPEIVGTEDKLRKIWSNPNARENLLKKLSNHGCSIEYLYHLRKLIDAEESDIYDVLQYIAFNTPTLSRKERVKIAEENVYNILNKEEIEFVRFVLNNYIQDGIDELNPKNLSNILISKYASVPNAEKALGPSKNIKDLFSKFQEHLYSA